MNFDENDLVRIITTPSHPNEHLDQRIGYIDSIPPRRSLQRQQHYLVSILSEDGIEDTVSIAGAYLALDNSEEGKKFYAKHQETLDQIVQVGDEQQHQFGVVVNHLALKYGISSDEIKGIYKAVLCFDKYYKEHQL